MFKNNFREASPMHHDSLNLVKAVALKSSPVLNHDHKVTSITCRVSKSSSLAPGEEEVGFKIRVEITY